MVIFDVLVRRHRSDDSAFVVECASLCWPTGALISLSIFCTKSGKFIPDKREAVLSGHHE